MDSYVAVPGRNHSIAYFNCVTVFEALQHRTSVKGRAHMHCVDAQILDMSMQHV